jgi:hypothetical protein
MREIINDFIFKVDLFEKCMKGKFTYITSIYCELVHDHNRTLKECICEAIRKKLYNIKASTKTNQLVYKYEQCIASVPEYPMPSGYINRGNPLLISDWPSYGVENEVKIKHKVIK